MVSAFGAAVPAIIFYFALWMFRHGGLISQFFLLHEYLSVDQNHMEFVWVYKGDTGLEIKYLRTYTEKNGKLLKKRKPNLVF